VDFVSPQELFTTLEARAAGTLGGENTVGGYKVKVSYRAVPEDEKKVRTRAISEVILQGLRKSTRE
jgi:hypothetical protein